MSNVEKLNSIFKEVFSVDDADLEGLNNDNADEWDSVHQLSLTSMIEDEFDIMLDAEDIIEFTSYKNAKKILTKYEIEI